MVHIAICDDDEVILKRLNGFISDFFCKKAIQNRIFLFYSGEELLQSWQKIDILFLDIQMGRVDGMETARRLRSHGYRGEIIFITILKEMVFHAFEVRAFDFLLKPLKQKDFQHTMERLLDSITGTKEGKLFIQKGTENYIISFEDILYSEVIDRKIYLHLDSGEVVDYYDRMDHLAERLDNRFYRCHRSYLINLQYLESYQNHCAYMAGGDIIPVSRFRSKDFSHVVLKYMKEWRS